MGFYQIQLNGGGGGGSSTARVRVHVGSNKPTCEVMHEPHWTDHLSLHSHLGETSGLFMSSSNRMTSI